MRLLTLWIVALASAAAQQPGTFPAMQRPPGDAEVIARGKAVFSVNCSACHGADARGGQLNGPNLLRSQLVLADKDGELIAPVLKTGRPERGMPALPLADADVTAVIAYVHSLLAASPGQGAPPRSDAPPPDIVVGNADAGRAFFESTCRACHAPDGDLAGIATRTLNAKTLQNLWVSGGKTRFRARGRGADGRDPSAVTATVSLRSGERVTGRLVLIDDFIVKLAMADETIRSFSRTGDVPRVEIVDPLQRHKELLSVLTDADMRNVTAYLVTLK